MTDFENAITIIDSQLKTRLKTENLYNKTLNQGHVHGSWDVMYHYTDLAGFIGIIENQCLYATQTSFVNDFKELSYGHNFFTSSILNLKKELSEITKPDILDKLSKKLLEINYPELYTTCFSMEPDLLSLWRGYTNDGQGIAIGFNVDLLDSLKQQVRSTHIAYNDEDKKKIIIELLKISIDFIKLKAKDYNLDDLQVEQALIRIIPQILFEYFLSIKHIGFKEEREYRYIYGYENSEGKDDIKEYFKTNGKFIIPYVKLEAKTNKLLPIEKIIIGPSNYKELLKQGIVRILLENGYNPIPIEFSEVPYRN